MKPRLVDPTGPGTVVWEAFDHTIEYWQAFVASGQKTRVNGKSNPLYKKYSNTRQYLFEQLARNGADLAEWKASLEHRLNIG